MFTSIEEVQRLMEAQSYIADRALATTLFLAIKLEKPIFLEGEAGVGKTEVAKVLRASSNHGSFVCSVMKASMPIPPSTSGTTRSRC